MKTLGSLTNETKFRRQVKRVGRGPGSGKGKTCGRGEKGAGARSGYKRRLGYEGGQFRMFMKLPIRGFNNAHFRKELHIVNLGQIDAMYEDNETVNIDTLRERGFISGPSHGLKILGHGEITKKISIQANEISEAARVKLNQAKIECNLIGE
jgi:large subunit ribosomal protein L15